jgi:hypothetical protein
MIVDGWVGSGIAAVILAAVLWGWVPKWQMRSVTAVT